MIYYKWIHRNEAGRLINRDYEYKIGQLHTVPNFNNSRQCTSDAFYVCKANDIDSWSMCGNTLFEVEVPEGAQVIDLYNKLKVDCLRLVREAPWPELIKNNPVLIELFEFVPEDLITCEMCLLIVSCYRYNHLFEFIPEHLKTLTLCIEATNHDPYMIDHVPDHFKTYDMCLAAVRLNRRLFKYVPDLFKTEEMCLISEY